MDLLGVEWARPLGLLALALPVVVLLLARTLRPPAAATGTLELWRAVAGLRASGGRRARRRIPPRTIVIALALAAGALALAGPRAGAGGMRTWRVYVDRSPSMYLRGEGSGAGGESRLARAASAASAALASRIERGDAIEWIAGTGGNEEALAGRELPAAWLEPPRAPRDEPAWERLDQPGTIWVTDAAPETAPRRAGLAASGGAAVPGPIATLGALRLDWDGERIVEAAEPAPVRHVAIDAAVPDLLREFLEVWARERALEIATDPAGASLHVSCARCGADESLAATAGRDGWIASGELAREGALDADAELGPLEPWLTAELGSRETPVVTRAPGRIDVAWRAVDAIAGDPAAFAVSWSELLDAALLPAAGVVALSERLDAGPELLREPAELPEPARSRAGWLPLDALLAALAAVLSFAAARPPATAPAGARPLSAGCGFRSTTRRSIRSCASSRPTGRRCGR